MWLYKDKEIKNIQDLPDNVFGFVYLIINNDTTEYYIGRKNLYSERTLPPLKNQKRKRKVTKESNWKTYKSSHPVVKEWKNTYREIIEFVYTKKMLTVREMQAILCLQGLEDPKCLNDNVLGKIFRGDFEKEKQIKNG